MSSPIGSNIKVFVRLRPPQPGLGDSGALSVQEGLEVVSSDNQRWTFDRVFDDSTKQESVFEACGKPLVEDVIKGFNCTVFAYGQTGSGKSHTIFGPDSSSNRPDDPERGLLPRVLELLFSTVRSLGENTEFLCKGSMVELYNEQIYDLLDPAHGSEQTLQLRESMHTGVYVENKTEIVFETAQDALHAMQRGAEGRRLGATAMNRESSRSHTVFTLTLESKSLDADNVLTTRTAHLNVVDLAGSERQKLTQACGERQKEANYINKSLMCLGTVISALSSLSETERTSSFRPHIKYRDSKLTFLLRDSLGGNSKTYMIANVNPLSRYYSESLSTLKFAQRAKLIRNSAKVNEDLYADVSALKSQILNLKNQLKHQERGGRDTDIQMQTSESEQVDDDRKEQLLSHSLSMTETARKRADALEKLAASKGEACEKLKKSLTAQVALFKMKTAQLAHCMKGHPTAEIAEKWRKDEEKQREELRELNVEAVKWRTQYDELASQQNVEVVLLESCREKEIMNRKLCEEVRELLDSKRNLQDLMLNMRNEKENQTEFRNLTSNGTPQTPEPRKPKSPIGSRNSKTRTPVNRAALFSPYRKVSTPTRADFNRLELEHLCKKQQQRISELESDQAVSANDKLNKEIETLNIRIEALDKERLSDQQLLKKTQDQLAAVQLSENKHVELANDLSQKLEASQSEAEEKKALMEELENVRAQAELIQTQLERSQSEHDEKVSSMQAELERLREAEIAYQMAEKDQELHQQLLYETAQTAEDTRAAQRKTDLLKLASLGQELDQAHLQIKALQADQKEKETLNEQLRDNISSLQQALAEYRHTLQNERQQSRELTAQAENNVKEMQDLQRLLDDGKLEFEGIKGAWEQTKQELDQAQDSLQVLETEFNLERTNVEKEKEELQSLLVKAKLENEELMKSMEQTKLDLIKMNQNQMELQVSKHNADKQALVFSLDQAKASVKEHKDAAEKAVSEASRLKNELEMLQNQVHEEKEIQIKQHRQEIAEERSIRVEKLKGAQNSMAQLNKVHEKLRSELAAEVDLRKTVEEQFEKLQAKLDEPIHDREKLLERIRELEAANAVLAGNGNPLQKIKYLEKVTEKNRKSEQENAMLLTKVAKLEQELLHFRSKPTTSTSSVAPAV